MTCKRQIGFTLVEAVASLAVLVGVSAIVMSGMNRMMTTQGTVANRTEMHTSVRSATELLEQEIGQAGRIAVPNPAAPVTLTAAAAQAATTLTVSSSAGMFANGAAPFGEQLVIDAGPGAETVQLSAIAGNVLTIGVPLQNNHANGAPVTVLGGFATGVVPPDNTSAGCSPAGYVPVAPYDTTGSNCTTLKLYGDINSDGNMVYVEYTCQQGTPANPGFLYRNQMPYTAAAKPAINTTMILLNNVLANPNDANGNQVPCFSYQIGSVVTANYVLDVAVTLTEQTQNPDPQTRQFQQETKALLNVSPRNVFYTYHLARLGLKTRVQPMPPSVTNLLK